MSTTVVVAAVLSRKLTRQERKYVAGKTVHLSAGKISSAEFGAGRVGQAEKQYGRILGASFASLPYAGAEASGKGQLLGGGYLVWCA